MISARSFWCCTMLVVAFGTKVFAQKEYFSSVVGLGELFNTETFLLQKLQSYAANMSSQLDRLKRELNEIEKEHSIAAGDLEEYLTSPINAYLLIKRLDKDWGIFEQSIQNEKPRKDFLDAMKYARDNLSFPTQEDAVGSTLALVRLQETYKLDVSQVAAGFLNGIKSGSSMSWQDCFQLGQQLYSMKDYNHTIPWLKESFEKLQAQADYNSSERVQFIEMMAFYYSQMGVFETAMDLVEKSLELEPGREYSIDLKKYLETMIEKGYGVSYIPSTVDIDDYGYRATQEFKDYEKICRGDIKPEPWEERDLRCMYFHRNVPYLLLMPFKMEQLSLDPFVILLHDVLSDEEIDPIKEMAKPKMVRSQVRSLDGAPEFTTVYRTSQNSWIGYDDLPQAKALSKRLGYITGLNMDANEKLQVANYGLGGHYEPHQDFHVPYEEEDGHRIATAIFYLSDIDQGGATAFTHLRKAVQPKKGSLMFWYNLHKSGEFDYRTKHAACPVLKGCKWVANVWIRDKKQMFHRPCGLFPDHHVSLPYRLIA